jgi:hypothetical protein
VDRETGNQLPNAGDNELYAKGILEVKDRFSRWKRIHLVQGRAPSILNEIPQNGISFLHIDLNSPAAEVESVEYLWNSVVQGGLVLFDDYTYMGCEDLRMAVDAYFVTKGLSVLALPTGQGLVLKP